MNKVFLIGRLSRDPELRHTTSGTAVCQLTVAVSRPPVQGSDQTADFINVVVWNKPAENVAKYMTKGRQIAVEGRIQTRNYDNNEGRKVYVTEVVASNVEFLGSSDNSGNRQSNYQDENPFDSIAPANNAIDNQPTMSVDDDPFASFGAKVEITDNSVSDSDLPF